MRDAIALVGSLVQPMKYIWVWMAI